MILRSDLAHWTGWNVAVTGMNLSTVKPGRPAVGAAVARCLRELPVYRGRVIGLGCGTLDPGLYYTEAWGETCDAGYVLPDPAAGAGALMQRLSDILRHQRIDAIIPCQDAELPHFIKLAPALGRLGVRVLLPTPQSLERCAPQRLPELGTAAGILTPRVTRIDGASFLEHWASLAAGAWVRPLVIRSAAHGACLVHTPVQARQRLAQMAGTPEDPLLTQDYVPGVDLTLTALGDGSGALIGPVMLQKQPTYSEQGNAWVGVTIDHPPLLAAGERLMQELRWRGPLEMRMRSDPQGLLHLIGIVPHFPAWVHLSHAVGRNLPAALLALLQEVQPVRLEFAAPRPGMRFIGTAHDGAVRPAAPARCVAGARSAAGLASDGQLIA